MRKKVTLIVPKDTTRKYKICIHDYSLDVNMVMELGHASSFNEMKKVYGLNFRYFSTATERFIKDHKDCTQIVYIWEELL